MLGTYVWSLCLCLWQSVCHFAISALMGPRVPSRDPTPKHPMMMDGGGGDGWWWTGGCKRPMPTRDSVSISALNCCSFSSKKKKRKRKELTQMIKCLAHHIPAATEWMQLICVWIRSNWGYSYFKFLCVKLRWRYKDFFFTGDSFQASWY